MYKVVAYLKRLIHLGNPILENHASLLQGVRDSCSVKLAIGNASGNFAIKSKYAESDNSFGFGSKLSQSQMRPRMLRTATQCRLAVFTTAPLQ